MSLRHYQENVYTPNQPLSMPLPLVATLGCSASPGLCAAAHSATVELVQTSQYSAYSIRSSCELRSANSETARLRTARS